MTISQTAFDSFPFTPAGDSRFGFQVFDDPFGEIAGESVIERMNVEIRLNPADSIARQFSSQSGVVDQELHFVDCCFNIAFLYQEAGRSIGHQFRNAGVAGADDRQSAGVRFYQGDRQSFTVAV